MKWENLSKLIDIIRDKMGRFDHFLAKLEYGVDQRDKINSNTC
jgi:hypothetical protein